MGQPTFEMTTQYSLRAASLHSGSQYARDEVIANQGDLALSTHPEIWRVNTHKNSLPTKKSNQVAWAVLYVLFRAYEVYCESLHFVLNLRKKSTYTNQSSSKQKFNLAFQFLHFLPTIQMPCQCRFRGTTKIRTVVPQ